MAEGAPAQARLAAAGIEVRNMPGMHAAVLRYFERGGAFAAAVRGATGTELPGPLAAAVISLTTTSESELVLAWSRPTETVLVTEDGAALGELMRRLASADGGYVVNLSGGLAVLRLAGTRVAELIGRLGGAGVPPPLQARRGRLADVPVLAVCVRAGEILLVVDRSLAGHLTAWIGETLVDFRR
ncbi:MAG: sarcosine oxidase subunit gamma family protein [Steroidobacteraceae bacterium]|jgi:hypothetical protein